MHAMPDKVQENQDWKKTQKYTNVPDPQSHLLKRHKLKKTPTKVCWQCSTPFSPPPIRCTNSSLIEPKILETTL